MIKKSIVKSITLSLLSSFCSKAAIGETETFNADDTFTVPAGVNSINIQAWGGGGPGSFSQGGGGGSFCAATVAVTPGSNVSIKVGAGGVSSTTQGTPPTPGGQSSVPGTDVAANGGSAGQQPSGNPPSFIGGAGGTIEACTASGATKFAGGEGGRPKEGGGGGGGGSATDSTDGAKGGDATETAPGTGGNGQGAGGNGGAIGAAGSAGIAPGGGGGGGGSSQTAQVADGNGARGQVIISYTPQINGNAPIVTTNAPSNITKTSVTLNGMVNANGAPATASFDFGTSSSYGTNIAATPSSVTGTSTVVATKSNLTCETTYHYRVTAVNNAGTSNGTNKEFTTAGCGNNVQANLESPQQNSYESGVGLIRGWACSANLIELQIDNGIKRSVPYGSNRGDTQSICGDTNNGFGFTYNWNSLGNGVHNLKLFVDNQEFANVDFNVTTLGIDYLVGAGGEYVLNDFLQFGDEIVIKWSEPHQNFIIVGYSP